MARPGNPTYLPASFKGVPFDAVSSSDEFGRRGHEYEYPLAEHTSYKDLGRKIRRYKVEGRITGPDHIALTVALKGAAESPEPGMLMHPTFGPVMVACVSLSTSVEYHDKKRFTAVDFEFVEASPSLAPFALGGALSALLGVVSLAVSLSTRTGGATGWTNSATVTRASNLISNGLVEFVKPIRDPEDEESFDVVDKLNRGIKNPKTYDSFQRAADAIIDGTATIRAIHADALKRLRAFNTVVVDTINQVPQVEALGVTARLALAADYSLTAAQVVYPTIAKSIEDLDFVVSVYDEEEAIASRNADDVLSTAIASARATAASTILARNIALPGITTFDARGRWPSLVSAHLIYGDSTRHVELESYNPTNPTFFMQRALVGPAR